MMENYKNYIQHTSLEIIVRTVLMIFVFIGVFIVGASFSPERKYLSKYEVSITQN